MYVCLFKRRQVRYIYHEIKGFLNPLHTTRYTPFSSFCGKANFATRLLAFACVEGIFFSGSFCSLFWLKQKGVMPGLTFSNELISRDEGLHTDFAVILYKKYIVNKIPQDVVYSIFKDGVQLQRTYKIIYNKTCSRCKK